ncbi:MAG: MBL fold metallo-hydrolase [Candidatus Micrarchaeota archaeon]|nr:MBL fold metallo-hydrolase [Candidatus Micrarchaeota archaeon]MDE1823979.1 MBL fold metallo-hydrolase [Candidatus Micrarchaeota archaeon]MDE1849977.1 MBL fold metallo-hydrolase [Candidatus Micrarchaeota archaeon]
MEIGSLNWIGHASFLIRDLGKNIYIDPFMLNGVEDKADIIFITHPHFDHLNQDDLKKITTPDTTVIVPKSCAKEIKKGEVFPVEPNRDYGVDGIKFRTLPAYNIVSDRLDKHPVANGWVGYVLEISGTTIYHTGDTDFIPEMNGLEVDIALLPMSGTYTMDVNEAIDAAHAIKAGKFIPMHYKAVLGEENSKLAEQLFKKRVKNSLLLKEIIPAKYSFQ